MKRLVMLFFLSILFIKGTNRAVEYDIYGTLSAYTFWTQPQRWDYDSLWLIETLDTITWITSYDTIWGSDSVDLILNDWYPTGQFGIKFKMGKFGACIELGIARNSYDANLTGSETTRYLYQKYNLFITAPKWYAEWYINDYFSLLMGSDYTPANFFTSNRLLGPEIGFSNMGCLFVGSRPMFQLCISTEEDLIEAKIAVAKADTSTIHLHGTGTNVVYVNEVKMPKIEGSFQFNKDFSDMFGLRVKAAGGVQNYASFGYPDINQEYIKDSLQSKVLSYLYAGELSVKLWRFTSTFSMFGGQNLGPYGVKIGTPYTWWRLNDYIYARNYYPVHDVDSSALENDPDAVLGSAQVYNSNVIEMALIINWKITDWVSIEGGYQEIIGDHEFPAWDKRWLDGSNYGWYAQTMFTIMENMRLTAEGGFTKYGKYKGFGNFAYGGFGLGVDF